MAWIPVLCGGHRGHMPYCSLCGKHFRGWEGRPSRSSLFSPSLLTCSSTDGWMHEPLSLSGKQREGQPNPLLPFSFPAAKLPLEKGYCTDPTAHFRRCGIRAWILRHHTWPYRSSGDPGLLCVSGLAEQIAGFLNKEANYFPTHLRLGLWLSHPQRRWLSGCTHNNVVKSELGLAPSPESHPWGLAPSKRTWR